MGMEWRMVNAAREERPTRNSRRRRRGCSEARPGSEKTEVKGLRN